MLLCFLFVGDVVNKNALLSVANQYEILAGVNAYDSVSCFVLVDIDLVETKHFILLS
jgi:hypothetical protein